MSSSKTKYVIVGTGGRHEMYRDALVGKYSEHRSLAGLCDINEGRANLSARIAKERFGADVPVYLADHFDRMLDEQQPDVVIVTSKDSTHHKYICRAMEKGCDIITEKPLTISAEQCREIFDAKQKTGRSITVTFNYRYAPPRTQVKELLRSGTIGDILSVDFHWMLDIKHGADYFRRWHRNKENSGGLMVHKATHHFDAVNWWLETTPETVYAQGARRYYTPETAEELGLTNRGSRCHTCAESGKCPYFLDLDSNDSLRSLYLDCEKYDGYFRDQCVFSDQIDIEDTMCLVVKYRDGILMSYSLNAFMPWEGYHVVFNGSRGRLEYKTVEDAYINADGAVPGELDEENSWIRVFPHHDPSYEIELWKAHGGHGGGDDLILEDLFAQEKPDDHYGRCASHIAGAWSILTGIAANQSIQTGQAVNVEDIFPGLE